MVLVGGSHRIPRLLMYQPAIQRDHPCRAISKAGGRHTAGNKPKPRKENSWSASQDCQKFLEIGANLSGFIRIAQEC